MRNLVLGILLLAGCGLDSRATVKVVESVADPSGRERLIRKDWETTQLSAPQNRFYGPHSLVWQRKQGEDWVDIVTITEADFQRGRNRRRWVSAIHSFDADNGRAILKIAEGDAPEGSGKVSYVYSWREWDLSANKEVRTIRVCADPFEAFE